ncbi:MAG: tetratricopeptide repeat protein [Verrucomicrobiota bacterium]|nr:tetratricopeptide repeat protein [Verrucomicrobiota bacterium]
MADEIKKKSQADEPAQMELPIEYHIEQFWLKYKNPIVFGVILILAFAIFTAIYKHNLTSKEQDSLVALNKAVTAGNIDQVASVFETYRGTKAASQALLLVADMNFQRGQYTQSQELYQRFIREYPQNELLAAAFYGVGACQQASGKVDEALSTYLSLQKSKPTEIWTYHGLLAAASCYEIKGQPAAARKIYQDIISGAAPDSIKMQAQFNIKRLG